jgi:hypothetical protein
MSERSLVSLCVEDVDEEYLCAICSDVLVKPHQCKDGHVFCLACINQWLQTKKNCPICRISLKSNDLGNCRVIENVVGKTIVRCRNSSMAVVEKPATRRAKRLKTNNSACCEWTGAMSALDYHVENDCMFSMIGCPNADKGCLKQMERQLVAEHLESCLYECVTCEYCAETGICKARMGQHLAVCNMVIVSCINKCGLTHLRQEKDAHEAVCPQAIVTCPFVSHGCDVAGGLRRCDYNTHQVEAAVKHSELVATGLDAVKHSIARSEAAHQALITAELANIQNDLQISETKFAKLEKDQLVGEVTVSWNANVDNMRASPDNIEYSKQFSVHIPVAGEYKCCLGIGVETEGFVDLFIYIKEGPIFPVSIAGTKITCGPCSNTFGEYALTEPQSRGFRNLMSDAEVEAAKIADGCIPITAHFKLRWDGTLLL